MSDSVTAKIEIELQDIGQPDKIYARDTSTTQGVLSFTPERLPKPVLRELARRFSDKLVARGI